MDEMDIDQIEDVPDTPDRLNSRAQFDKSGPREEIHSGSDHSQSGQRHFFEEVYPDSGRKRTIMRRLKGTSISSNPVYPKKNKEATERRPSHNDVVDLSDKSVQRHVFMINQSGIRKKPALANGATCSRSTNMIPTLLGRGNEGANSESRVGSAVSNGEGLDSLGSVQTKPADINVVHLDSTPSPVLNKQKRLVRNGCISPNNIAKAKQLPLKEENASVAVVQNTNTSIRSSAPPVSVDIMDLVAEDNHSRKGKGKAILCQPSPQKELIAKNKHPDIMDLVAEDNNSHKGKGKAVLCQPSPPKELNAKNKHPDIMDLVAEDNNSRKGKGKAVLCQPSPPKELNAKNKHPVSRSSLSLRERLGVNNDCARDFGRVREELSGWRSTRNRHRKTHLSLSDEDHAVVEEVNDPNCAGQQLHDRKGRSDKDTCVPTSQSSSLSESGPSARTQLISHQTTSTHPVRLKPRSASSSFNECSTSARNDPEVVLITSPEEPSTSRLTSRRGNNSKRVIEVERSSPELSHDSVAEEVRMRQLEADERLARELQEQLYNEGPALEVGEFDEQFGMALQHQSDSAHRTSRSTRQRSSLISDLRRESQLRSSNATHRAFQSRAPNFGRTARMRSRFPGLPRALLPSTGRTSVFPADMDIESRINFLGAMEAFSDMGVAPGPGFYQTQRDFNENDYEMLLALDENNDRHSGASVRVINGLPESTVQSDNFDEACAVCLETPTIGDAIRHLPCLHKFHKDCIDPWLRRKPSCPVCKSSIT